MSSQIKSVFSSRLFFACFTLLFLLMFVRQAYANTADFRQMAQLAEYIGVDYEAAIEDGKIINVGEYEEMVEFADLINEKSHSLDLRNEALITYAGVLKNQIDDKAALDDVRISTANLGQILLSLSPQLSLPTTLMTQAKTRLIFDSMCVSCHGQSGRGDGILAAQLEPSPTDFSDKSRALNRSLLGLYGAISNGIDGTAMVGYTKLSEQERWSLTFMVGGLAFAAPENFEFQSENRISKEDMVLLSPNTLLRNQPGVSRAWIEAVRSNPDGLFTIADLPLDVTRKQLNLAYRAYKNHQFKEAKTLSVSAYLDGFELIENSLDAKDKPLRRDIEAKLLGLRKQFSVENNAEILDPLLKEIFNLLDEADVLLTKTSLSDATLFSASFIILLREGLEALLVVIALTTVLIRSNRRDALRYVHLGWVSAFGAGFATWLVAQYIVAISGASREVMEGVAALLAAVVLFWVGFWMHSKTNADQWHEYIQNTINKKLQTGALWGIAGLSFIAVYREVFETVLFYQSLLTQTQAEQYFALWGGLGSAVIALVGIGWAMIYFSQKLPIGRFFSSTAYLLLALSFVLTGKAVSALQEAAIITISDFPVHIEFDWLGVSSTWEGLGAQGLVIILSTLLILKNRSGAVRLNNSTS